METHSRFAETFAVLMAHHREAKGLSLSQLGREMGLGRGHASYLSRVERGLIEPSIGRALEIAAVLGIEMEELGP